MDGSGRSSRFRVGKAAHSSHGPQLAIYIAGRFFRLVSVYAAFNYLSISSASISIFTFVCIVISAPIFLIFQRPWHGRPVSNTQLVSTVLNGAVLALSLLFWGKSLVTCGPVRTVLAEYTGAVLGAASTLALGRGGNKWKKLAGLIAMLAAFYFLSQGWAMASSSPFKLHKGSSSEQRSEQDLGLTSMGMSIIAGTLQALRRVIARRVSMKTQSKKRFHSITVASAACFLFPVAMFLLAMGGNVEKNQSSSPAWAWAYISTIVFGIVMAFYVDSYAEDRLQIHASSPLHLLITACGLLVLELLHGMDFSLLGFIVCCSVLGLGIFEATTMEPNMSLPFDSNEDVTRLHRQSSEEFLTFESLVPP